jgi:hypothetical protein
MKYSIQFSELQIAAATLHAVGHAMKRNNVAPKATTWAVAYNSCNDGVEIFAACDSGAVVVFERGEVVFSAGRSGQILSFQPGEWIVAVNALYTDAITAGYLVRPLLTEAELEANCPDFYQMPCAWMDEIEATREPWELAA